MAPKDFKSSVCLKDAVAMMGENPEILANCNAAHSTHISVNHAYKTNLNTEQSLPTCPTELEAPRMTNGVPAYFPTESAEVGGVKLIPYGLELYNPTYAVVKATGRGDTSSYVKLDGIC